MATPERYGEKYWCIGLADGTEAFFHGDRLHVDGGAILVIGGFRTEDQDGPDNGEITVAAFGPGAWNFAYAASVLDGHAIAASHWPGQIVE